MATYNQQVHQKIQQIAAGLDSVKTTQELYDLVHNATDNKLILRYDFALFKVAIIIGIVLSLFAGVFYLMTENQTIGYIFKTAWCIIIGYGLFLVYRQQSLRKLEAKIQLLDAFLDNHLKPSQHSLARKYQSQFSEFQRGKTSSREIIAEYDGFEGDEAFTYYQFKYIDKVKKISKGKVEVSNETFYRSGFMFEFPYAKNIAIIGDKGLIPNESHYQVSSIAFNEKFKLGSLDDMELARFLNPKIVEVFLNIPFWGAFRVEISADGILCLAFSEPDFLSMRDDDGNNLFSLEHPDSFLENLKQKTHLPKLTQVIDFIKEIKKFSDDNFKGE